MPTGYTITGVAVEAEGLTLGFAANLNFTGSGVTVSFSGGTASVNISGGSGPQPSANDLRFTAEAGENVIAGELMSMDVSGNNPGTVLRSRALNSEPSAVGVAASSAAAGASVQVVTNGTLPILFQEPLALADMGRSVYVSASVSGRATLTPPSMSGQSIVMVGILVSTSAGSSTGFVSLNLMPVARLL